MKALLRFTLMILFTISFTASFGQKTFTHLGISFQIPEGWEVNNISKDKLLNSITLTCEPKGGGSELVDIHMLTKTKAEIKEFPADSVIFYTIGGLASGRSEASDRNKYKKTKLGSSTVTTLSFVAKGNNRQVRYSLNGYLACDGVTFVYINYRMTDGQQQSSQLKSLFDSFRCKK